MDTQNTPDLITESVEKQIFETQCIANSDDPKESNTPHESVENVRRTKTTPNLEKLDVQTSFRAQDCGERKAPVKIKETSVYETPICTSKLRVNSEIERIFGDNRFERAPKVTSGRRRKKKDPVEGGKTEDRFALKHLKLEDLGNQASGFILVVPQSD